jgi:enoyl-[acyl-carrier-protein] reductase (NADH)
LAWLLDLYVKEQDQLDGYNESQEKITSGVVWLLSDGASCATGMIISVDGGYVAQ